MKHLFACLLLTLCLVGYFVPIVAIVPAFFVFFLTTGYFLVAKLKLGVVERLAVSILASILLSTHLVFLASLLFGYSREVVFVIMSLLSCLLFFVDGNKALADLRGLKDCKGVIAFALVAFLFVGLVLHFSLWKHTDEGIVNGGWNWSDFFVHYSIIQSVNSGNFPPQTPYYSGTPLLYHYFMDFHTAIVSKATPVFAVHIVVFEQALLAFALVLLGFAAADYFLKSRKAAFIAVLLLVFGGGLGYIAFIDQFVQGNNAFELIKSRSFDNNWDSWPFQVPSVMGTGLLTHRATTAGLPVLIAVILLLITGFNESNKKKVFAAGLLAGLVAPFHAFVLPASVLLAFLFFLTKIREWRQFSIALYFILPLAIGIPFVLRPFVYSTVGSMIKLNLGWESHAKSFIDFALFYVLNFGFPFLFALLGILFFKVREKAFLFLWMLVMFAIPNIVTLTYVYWDMNKFFQYMWIPTVFFAAVALQRMPKFVVFLVILLSIPSPLLVSAWFVTHNGVVFGNSELGAYEWIASNTNISDVFVTETQINQATDAAGRLRVITFIPYVWNNGFDPQEREKNIKEIYCSENDTRALELMKSYNATHIIVRQFSSECTWSAPAIRASDIFEKAFEQGNIAIYEVKGEMKNETGQERN